MTAARPTSSRLASNANTPRTERRDASSCDDGLSTFLTMRPRLFGIAYRMLGSAAEAEDVVQDAWLRWQTTDHTIVRDAAAFLATTATRLAINAMQSARARRETYVDTWQPEPVDTSRDPRLAAERDEALVCGVRMLLERLTPTERAAYILREAFDYPYRDIASVLRLAEANARQVVTRARQHIVSSRMTPMKSMERERLLEAFIAAAHHGDVEDLEGVLAADSISPPRGRSMTSHRSSASGQSFIDTSDCGFGIDATVNTERTINHETRHHRWDRADRLKARHQAA